MAGEGQILRNAREEKGWSINQAEEVTKIRIRYLEALEAENYAILPGATYIKGFLRTYSKHLGLNSDEIVSLYKASQVNEEQSEFEPVIHVQSKKPQWVKPALAVATGLLALAVVIGIATLSKPEDKTASPQFTPTPLPSAPQVESAQQPETNVQPQAPVQPSQTPTPTPAEVQGLKAQIVFTEPTWLVVKVDGQPALEGTFQKGITKELTANDRIELVTVGNAGGVSITLNGKAIPSLGASGQVVRNVVLKKDNLTQVSLLP
jgi:cytoskeleton protein RodZ